jgi:hypothetical protein
LLIKFLQNYYTKYLLTVFLIVGGYLVLIFFDSFYQHRHKTLCLFKLTTGIPCPGCGMGRATLELIKGDIVSSFNYNILCIPFTIALLVSIFWLLTDIAKRQSTFFDYLNQKLNSTYKNLLLGVIIIDWIANIIRKV